MDPVEYFEAGRWLEAELGAATEAAVPAGCRGMACPFFAECRGRCEEKREATAHAWTPAPLPAEPAAAR
jgi:hypothetical protein